MADEAPQEAPVEAPVVEPVVEPNEAAPETPAELPLAAEAADDEGEPGGSSPQEIRARKEYRARRGVEKQLESERIERVRLEERLRTLEEVSRAQTPAPAAERVFTPQEVQAAIDAGQVSAAEGMTYLAKQEARRVIAEQQQAARAIEPFKRAGDLVSEYMAHLPWTQNQQSDEFKQVKAEYNRLVNEFGHANDIRTQLVALEKVAGPLDKLKARAQVATQTRQARQAQSFAETPAGGQPPRKSDSIENAPDHIKRVWDRTGLTPAQRAKEWGYYQKQQSAKAG